MYLKTNDLVKLLKWPLPQSPTAPIWGSTYGYHLGRVVKVHTNDHDKTKHIAMVEFAKGHSAQAFPESALEKADDEEISIYSRFSQGKGFERDIWALIRTTAGKFALNIIEVTPFGVEDNLLSKFVVGITKRALPSVDNSDYNIVGSMLSDVGYRETRVASLYSGISHLFEEWRLPNPTVLPLPLVEFSSIKEAVSAAPEVPGAAIALFHLPNNLYSYTETATIEKEQKVF